SSCSPDFGLNSLIDRLGQINPSVLFAVDGQFYKNKTHAHLDKVKQLTEKIPSINHTIVYNYIDNCADITALPNAVYFNDILQSKAATLDFSQLPFNHPLVIMFSSGTTGKPKCIVHGAGNTLIQHLKELALHSDIRKNDRLFFYTTCGWMMWNWMLSALAADATLVLYDGSPLHPNTEVLFDYIDKANVTHFGCGAKYIESIEKMGAKPIKSHDLSSLRCILTTASPLLPKSFDYVYSHIKSDVLLCSESGGTDIISCFALGNPTLPVHRGELQCLGLGMAVEIYNDDGEPVLQEKGELVCTQAFPSMPLYFWNDPDGKRYFDAYFNTFPEIWAHGDYAEITQYHGMIIYGRSDTTLNPGGVRIGTAEIYRQVETLDAVIESLAVGQQWQGSERIVLFVVLRDGLSLDDALIDTIKKQIRNNASPHHVPSKIIQVKELPRTISGKVVEIAIKHLIHGKPIKNKASIANPECLNDFFNDHVKKQLES
ncbi:MAG: acetoacetate--CoA ligase, partial [Gammaproteobacteria bacterium]|nr:acetoacetate--CoA ligase [Gammaproteobacteria bacterium]